MTHASSRSVTLALIVACLAVLAAPHASLAGERRPQVPAHARRRPRGSLRGQRATRHRRVEIDGVEIFYREAGPPDAPVVVLLHGFPTSSHMFRNLIPALADRYRVIAPDYPGFGQSAMPSREDLRLQLRQVRRTDRRPARPAGRCSVTRST